MDYSQIANLPNLQPGSSGNDVLTLQKWLVANGFLSQADMNTGPGTYGPKTTAAVAAWQKQSGIDPKGNPGYFGPISKSYIQSASKSATAPTQTTPTQITPTTSTTPTTPTTDQNWDSFVSKYGIDPNLATSLDPATKSFLMQVGTIVQGQYDQGIGNVSINSDLLNKAMTAAASDPTIQAIYGDNLAMGQSALQKNLSLVSSDYSTQMAQTLQEQELAQKNLKETEAAAGRAYSGYREQAQKQLDVTQSGVISSTKSQLQKQLNQLGQSYESQFGSAATPTISAGGLAYQPVGGITGSDVIAKKQAIESKGQSIYSMEASPQ